MYWTSQTPAWPVGMNLQSLILDILGLFEWFFIEFCLVVSRGSVYRALGFMVAASPCALAVAPLAYATAISACARKVIVNNFFQLLNPTDFYDIP
ncbi:hypothetical protein BHM03_00026709 [Ensete ventricosum]|nr:hypothetical protein BHM03_00026709 [Ensete ventricosum]